MVVGALVAIAQSDFRRLLAWSSIGQVGFILLPLGVGALVPEVRQLAVVAALPFFATIWLERRDHPALEPVRFADFDLRLALTEGGVARRDTSGLSGEETRPLAPEIWFDPAGFDEPFAYRLEGPNGAAVLSRGDHGRLAFQHQAHEGGR